MKIRKGVSSILGTILIISITLALGALLFGYSKGLFDNLTVNESLYTQFELLSSSSNGMGFLEYTIKNTGNVALHIDLIKIIGNKTDIININSTIQPGEEIQNITQVGSIVSGNYYTVLVIAQTQSGQQYDTVSNVLAVSE
ncbi:MAG: archaellin/type IV pilin N-terminal domain-containing protein [Metallosphaera sp.]|uniref:pilin subunit UpsA n=1 Tax=Metallosphaera sp. TaxID=2020860 RepID=UPI0031658689